MKITKTKIEGAFILQPTVLVDDRGYFYESYNASTFEKLGIVAQFVQDNEAKSSFGVVRGLHFQKNEFAQAKLVRVTQGRVLDVLLDLRKNSTSYGKFITVLLSGTNQKQIFIPRGIAHGYSVLSKTAVFNYKCDNYYSSSNEGGINPLDPILNIDWKIEKSKMIISTKDKAWPNFLK
ncbi:MAG: dTDP-4-dehydrorhamnose 3,5-epimerase [Saprospiraceae bacterium]